MKNKYQAPTRNELKTVHGPRPGAVALNDVIIWNMHKYGVSSAGIYNRRNVRGAKGAVIPSRASLHAVGRGVDIAIPNKAVGDALVAKLIKAADYVGICEIIWYGRRISTKGILPYRGVDKHRTHIHIGLTVDFASRKNDDNLRKWINHFVFGI